jgi:hypothetical protein
MISDANLSPEQALAQNPDSECPDEILHTLGLLTVEYLGFDDHIHVGQIVVAQRVMAEVETFFKHALELRFPIAKVVPVADPSYRWDGEKILTDNVSSGFDYRKIKTTDKLSLHSYGLAFDINPRQNPYIRYKNGKVVLNAPKKTKWEPGKPGVLDAEHSLVRLMEGFGWEWGGNWTPASGRTDYMHFQKAIDPS